MFGVVGGEGVYTFTDADLPKIVCNTTEMNSIRLRPNLSDEKPLRMPPVATPARKNISATDLRFC